MADVQPVRRSYADLPAELVRRIFAQAGDHSRLSVQDRLRAEAACRAWGQALRGLPFRFLQLGDSGSTAGAQSKQQWAASAHPAATNVKIMETTELSLRALHSLDRKALEQLILSPRPDWVGIDPRKFLPHPDKLPNLWSLSVRDMTWDHTLLEQLRQLQRLEQLDLQGRLPPASQPCRVSGLTALTRLYLSLYSRPRHVPAAQHLRIDLATLPSLLELHLDMERNIELRTLALAASGSPAPLHSLRHQQVSDAWDVAVDFAALPALTYLHLDGLSDELTGAATIAGATSLRCLLLGTMSFCPAEEFELTGPWVPELLWHAPPSLRSLHMCGCWPAAVSEALAGLTQLRVLSLQGNDSGGGPEDAPAVPRLGGGPVWERLRALRWASEAPLPEAARQATRLELLQYRPPRPLTLDDLRFLSSLPALRQLCVCGSWAESYEAGGVESATPELDLAVAARRLMPRLESVELDLYDSEGNFVWENEFAQE